MSFFIFHQDHDLGVISDSFFFFRFPTLFFDKKTMGNGNAKKCKRTSKSEENPLNNCINWMDELFLRFEHIPEQIFEELDFESLMNARLVAPSWDQFIDDRAHQWSSFKNEISELEKKSRNGWTPFHLSCQNGQKDTAETRMNRYSA